MRRWIRVCWWSAAAVAGLWTLTSGARRHLRSQVSACRTSTFLCGEAERRAELFCVLRFPGACQARDDAYRVEFLAAEALQRSCGENETYVCMNAQRFRAEGDRKLAAEAARRFCEHGSASGCVMLAIYSRDGLGVPRDRTNAARAFSRACELGIGSYCEKAAAMYAEEAGRIAHRAGLRELAERRTDRGVPDVQSFYVQGAKLSKAEPVPRDLEHELSRQNGRDYDPNSIMAGTSVVLSIRTFDPGVYMIIDDEGFEKLSIEMPSLRVGVPVDVASSDVRLYYAEGSSPWSPTAGQVFARQARGTVTVLSIDDARGIVRAHVDLACQPMYTDCSRYAAPPAPKEVHQDVSFVRKSIDELSAWLGGAKPGLRNFP